VRRLPIRLRLTAAFAVAMAVVLAATGALLYFRLASSLDEAIHESLEAHAAEVAASTARGERALAATAQDERFVQLLDLGGGVVDATPRVRERPLLRADEVARVRTGAVVSSERREVPGLDGAARILARPIETPDGKLVVVVGASLEERDEALHGLLGELLVVGPLALLVASLLGYALAKAALRPVEAMRAEAAAISATEPGRRLPIPSSHDEVSRLGDTLNDMLAGLESALERERRFVADASHELRTPLALLKAELELALRRPRSAAELEQALRSAAVETDRLAQLAEDLLVLARSDQGRLPLRRDRVPVHDILSRIAARFRPRAETERRAIELDAPEGLDVLADAVRLEQAVGNLVENGLRYGRGPICLNAVEHDGRIELHVLDEGAGFDPAFLPRAFERFSRTDEARAADGVGLGLAIAQVIASAHGGSAHAANRATGGADVWLSIPKT
jgi:two-component system, OmpR family, sensor kinase